MVASSASVQRRRGHPAQFVVGGFAATVAVGTGLLMLPLAAADGRSTGFVDALFTAVSAVCVTGLTVVDTETYWSTTGQVIILALIQVGGIGIMTFASILALLLARRLDLRTRLTAAAETKSTGIGDIRRLVLGIVRTSVMIEAVVAVLLAVRFAVGYDASPGRAAWWGVFHAVSAFNNAGFALWSDNLVQFVDDPWICLPIAVAVILGGLGFPVLLEIRRELRPRRWSLHTRITMSATTVLLLGGTVFITASEWGNPGTLGAMSGPDRLLAGFFHAVMPRTAGFNSLDMGAMSEGTLLGTSVLMFIGGGSAGTAGGIKVTTFVLLLFVIVAEVRGDRHVNAFDRRLDPRVIRQAVTVALLSMGSVVVATIVLLQTTSFATADVLFESVSAFATVGLSTGITADLPPSAHLLLSGLMFLGRVGPITLVSALALRERKRMYTLPEGRPLIG